MATTKEIADALDLLATAFNEKMDPRRIELYAKTLDDIDGATLEAATIRYIKQGGKWFPKVYELRQMVQTVKATPPEDLNAIMYWNAMAAFFTPEAYTDRRYKRYFCAPATYEELSDEAKEWWDSLHAEIPEPANA